MSTPLLTSAQTRYETASGGTTPWSACTSEPRPSTARHLILVVTYDPATRHHLTCMLHRAGYVVVPVDEMATAWSMQRRLRPDLIVVDSMLAGCLLTDIEPVRPVLPNVPAIVLVEDWREIEQIAAVPEVVDYVNTPVVPQELLTRIAISLRRFARGVQSRGSAPAIVCGGLRIDVNSRDVSMAGRQVTLTALQFDLLHFLAVHPNRPLSRDHLLDAVWGMMSEAGPSAVTIQVRRLREQIEADPSHPRHLRTVWGVGYRFVCDTPFGDDGSF